MHMLVQVILAREYLKDVKITSKQINYLVTEAIRGQVQVRVSAARGAAAFVPCRAISIKTP